MLVRGFICEGPRCKKGPGDNRVAISWDEDRAKSDSDYVMPDEFFRFILTQGVFDENKGIQAIPRQYHFCSSSCLRDFYNESNYTPPRSPRELAIQEQANARVNAAKATPAVATETDTAFDNRMANTEGLP